MPISYWRYIPPYPFHLQTSACLALGASHLLAGSIDWGPWRGLVAFAGASGGCKGYAQPMTTPPILSAALLSLALSSPLVAQPQPAKDSLPPLPTGQTWKLIWQDEFDGPKLDETKWNRLGDHVRKGGWWVKEDAYLSGKGTLMLRTKKDGDRFTCGAMDTKGKYEHAFGYYVARLKMPKQPGHWPAFWLQTTEHGQGRRRRPGRHRNRHRGNPVA